MNDVIAGPQSENPAGSPKVVMPKEPAASEFKNFEKLADKLVQVPKSEIDEKRQKA